MEDIPFHVDSADEKFCSAIFSVLFSSLQASRGTFKLFLMTVVGIGRLWFLTLEKQDHKVVVETRRGKRLIYVLNVFSNNIYHIPR